MWSRGRYNVAPLVFRYSVELSGSFEGRNSFLNWNCKFLEKYISTWNYNRWCNYTVSSVRTFFSFHVKLSRTFKGRNFYPNLELTHSFIYSPIETSGISVISYDSKSFNVDVLLETKDRRFDQFIIYHTELYQNMNKIPPDRCNRFAGEISQFSSSIFSRP